MADVWAINGIDLHLELAGPGKARSLEAALRAAIRDARLAPGTRIPSSRTLAADLGLSRNTVAAVFDLLVAEGWLQAKTGAGTWVSARPGPAAAAAAEAPPASLPRFDLRGGVPNPGLFPRQNWSSAMRRVITDSAASDFGYSHPQGVPALRSALADYLARTRGTRSSAESVLVAPGFGDLLAIACRALVAAGARRVAVEEYGHDVHRRIIEAAGLRVAPVAVDADGIVVTDLQSADADAVLVTPAHQFPTGVPLAAHRRRELVQWAERSGALVLEDDYDGEFRFDRRSIGALQALAPQQVLYLGTASKSLAPALGLAWGIVPERMLAALLEQRELAGSRSDGITQLTLAEFMRSTAYDRHLRRVRSTYRLRREAVEAACESLSSECRISGLPAGLHCLLELPRCADEEAISSRALELGVLFHGLSSYLPREWQSNRGPAMVIGYGAPPDHRFDDAIAAALRAVTDVLSSP
jgi:GntR family transcriptional regulator/MocR family aminotransferase